MYKELIEVIVKIQRKKGKKSRGGGQGPIRGWELVGVGGGGGSKAGGSG